MPGLDVDQRAGGRQRGDRRPVLDRPAGEVVVPHDHLRADDHGPALDRRPVADVQVVLGGEAAGELAEADPVPALEQGRAEDVLTHGVQRQAGGGEGVGIEGHGVSGLGNGRDVTTPV